MSEFENDVSSAKYQPALDENWNAVSRGIINFNNFLHIDENVVTVEVSDIQESRRNSI